MKFLLLFTLVCCGLLSYSTNIGDFFVHDNFIYPLERPLRETIPNLPADDYLRLVPIFILAPSVSVSKSLAFHIHYFHLIKIIFHIFNAVAVFFLLNNISGNLPCTFLISMLFVLHPINAEAVAGAPLADVVCAAFYLFALLSLMRFRRTQRNLFYMLSLASFCLSLFSKEMALSLPVVIIACAMLLKDRLHFNNKDSKHRLIFEYIPYILFTIAYLMLRFGTKARLGGYGYLVQGRPDFYWVFREIGFMKGILLYLYRMIFYPYRYFLFPVNKFIFSGHLTALKVSTFIFVIFPLCYGLMRGIKDVRMRRMIIFAAAFIFLSCLPISFIIHSIDYNNGGLVNSRYLYLPCVGFAMLLGVAVSALPGLFIKRAIAAGIIVLYSILLFGNNRAWSGASEVSYQIPYQTKLLHPLTKEENKIFYFLSTDDELYFYKGIPVYQIESSLSRAFRLIYGFPVSIYTIDQVKLSEDRFFSRATDEIIAVTEGFDLRSAVLDAYVLRWNATQKKVEDLRDEVMRKLRVSRLAGCDIPLVLRDATACATPGYKDSTAFYLSSPCAVPLPLIGSVEIGLTVDGRDQPRGIGTLTLTVEHKIDFEIVADGAYRIYNIPVRMRRLSDLDGSVHVVSVTVPFARDRAGVSTVKILPYAFSDNPP